MITQALCTSFKKQLLEGAHDFRLTGGDTFKIALYTSSASLDASTTAYTATGEVEDSTGYTAGGTSLTCVDPTSTGVIAFVDFADASWASSSITARGALIYNSTPGHTYTNAAVAVLDFGSDKTSSSSTFTVVMPTADSTSAIVRIA